MRLLIVVGEPKPPMEDTELASQMIRLFAQRPRANRHHTPHEDLAIGEAIGVVGLTVLAVTLTILLFTW